MGNYMGGSEEEGKAEGLRGYRGGDSRRHQDGLSKDPLDSDTQIELANKLQAEADCYIEKKKEFELRHSEHNQNREKFKEVYSVEKSKYKQEKERLKQELHSMFKQHVRNKHTSKQQLKQDTKKKILEAKELFKAQKAKLLSEKQQLEEERDKLKSEKASIKVIKREMKNTLYNTLADQKEMKSFRKAIIRQIKRELKTSKTLNNSQSSSMTVTKPISSDSKHTEEVKKELTHEEQVLEDYSQVMQQYRQVIMFREGENDQVEVPKDLQHKHTNIRNKLGLGEGNPDYENNLARTFKILDIVNSQFLFVYDPDSEHYSVSTGKKLTEEDSKEDCKCYFNNEGRECIHCVEDFEKDEVLMKLNTCGHVFHAECAEECMFYSNTCPLCREVIYDHQ